VADRLRATPRWLLLLGTLALGFYLVNALHYGQLPLRIEENEWPPMAQAIYETGKPVIAAEDSHRIRYTEDLRVDQEPFIGAWHPPLYLYTLGASMVVLGEDASFSLRAIGVAALLISALLLLLIAREVTPRWRIVGGVAAALLLIHPYAIQGSLFLDVDTTIYAPAILLLLWLAIRFSKRQAALRPVDVLALGAAFALVTWTKMTTTVPVLCVLVVWWLLTRQQTRRAVVEAASFVLTGAALFFSTYALWCRLTDVPFSYTFDITFGDKSDRLFASWDVVELSAHWHVRWFGGAILVLTAVYLVDLALNYIRERHLRPLDLPFLVGLGILANYVLVSPSSGYYQGKYAFPALAMLLLPIVWMLLRDSQPHVRATRWLAAAGIALAAALLLPDLLTNLGVGGNYGSNVFDLRVIAAAGATLWLVWRLGGSRGFAGGVVVALIAFSVVQADRSYDSNHSPLYPVPDTNDFRAATADLNRTRQPGQIVVAPKDMGFYIPGPIIEGEDGIYRGDARLAAAIQRYPEISAFAFDSFGPPVGPATAEVLDRCFRERRSYGTASVAYRDRSCD